MAGRMIFSGGEAKPSLSNVWNQPQQHPYVRQIQQNDINVPARSSSQASLFPSSWHMYQQAAVGLPTVPVYKYEDYERGNGAPRYHVAVPKTEINGRSPLINDTNERIAAGYATGTSFVSSKFYEEDGPGRFSSYTESPEMRSLRDQWEYAGRNHAPYFRDFSAPPTYDRGYYVPKMLSSYADGTGVLYETVPFKKVKLESDIYRSVSQLRDFVERPTGDRPVQPPGNDLELWEKINQPVGSNRAKYNHAPPTTTFPPEIVVRQESADATSLFASGTNDEGSSSDEQCDLVREKNKKQAPASRVIRRSKSKRDKANVKCGATIVDIKTSAKSFDSQRWEASGTPNLNIFDEPASTSKSAHSSLTSINPKKKNDNFSTLRITPTGEKIISSEFVEDDSIAAQNDLDLFKAAGKQFMICKIEIKRLNLDELNVSVGDKSGDATMSDLIAGNIPKGEFSRTRKSDNRSNAYKPAAGEFSSDLAAQPIAQVVGHAIHSYEGRAKKATSALIFNNVEVPLDLSSSGQMSKSGLTLHEIKPTLRSFGRMWDKTYDCKPDITSLALEKDLGRTSTHAPDLQSQNHPWLGKRAKVSHSIANIVPECVKDSISNVVPKCVKESENLEGFSLDPALIEEMIRPAKPVFYSYLKDLRAEDSFIANANVRTIFGDAILLKLAADKERNPLLQMVTYMDSLLLFLQAGVVIESRSFEEGMTPEQRNSMKIIFTESLTVLGNMQKKFCAYSAGTRPQIAQNILAVFRMRSEAILLIKLHLLQMSDYKKAQMEVDNYRKECESENGPKENSSHVRTPYRILVAMKELHTFNNQTLRTPMHLWQRADELYALENLAFFEQIDSRLGSLVMHGSLFHLIRYIASGMEQIRQQLWPDSKQSTSIALATMPPIPKAIC